ncbi:MAG: type I methionyl aminopeptidase [Bifidobacteriaceae bacterium]|nr:type I methionyl aminopeptidase [Bifidobacteriaceae bacterium]
MIELRTLNEIDCLARAGAFVHTVLEAARETTKVGTNLLEIDELAHKMISDAKAVSSYFDYHPSFGNSAFGHYICTSINDAVLHGLPFDYALRDGDLVSLDFAASLDGWVGDSAISFIVGTPSPQDVKLIKATETALASAIRIAKPKKRLGDISQAIGDVGRMNGYTANMEFGGHGVGKIMHADPHVPNDGKRGRGYKLRPGLVIAIEPWFMQGTNQIYQDRDGWTLRSKNGKNGAHSEHTIAITDAGARILTL